MKPIGQLIGSAAGACILTIGVRLATMPTKPPRTVRATDSLMECAEVQQVGEENSAAVYRLVPWA